MLATKAQPARTKALQSFLAAHIEASPHQAIPFVEWMEQALYHPDWGYYMCQFPFGMRGDFTTAPELGNRFSETLAKQVLNCLSDLPPNSVVLEWGPGSGKMAGAILSYLHIQGYAGSYYLIEKSPYLQIQQQAYLQAHYPHLLDRFHWLKTPPKGLSGVMLANELLDAFPVERFRFEQGQYERAWVKSTGQATFTYQFKPCDHEPEALTWARPYLENCPQPYLLEYAPGLSEWLKTVYEALNTGVLFILDYGNANQAYYHSRHQQGNLRCFYQQRVHDAVFERPGLQDITAEVNFSTVAKLAEALGFEGLGYADQAHFLLSNGILDEGHPPFSWADKQALQIWLSPSEMGESIKVLALGKQWPSTRPISGFELKNRYPQLLSPV